jgi:CMD domain protein
MLGLRPGILSPHIGLSPMTPNGDDVSSYDVLDRALGVQPGDRLDLLRSARAETRRNAQLSYEAIFEPAVPNGVSVTERFALAVVISRWHGRTPLSAHYEDEFTRREPQPEMIQALNDIVGAGEATGPYGEYREEGLAAESVPGLRFEVPASARDLLGDELSALIEHVHMLVFRPREASAAALQRLLDEGWTSTDIVCVSQLVAFLAFQIRYANGLAVLAETEEAAA